MRSLGGKCRVNRNIILSTNMRCICVTEALCVGFHERKKDKGDSCVGLGAGSV